MSDEVVENKPVVVKKKKRKEVQSFSMDYWDDERGARKFMKDSFQDIAQNAKDRGIKTHLAKTKATDDGRQSIEVQFAEESNFLKRDGTVEKRYDFTGQNYIRVTYDPNRKFSQGNVREGQETTDVNGKTVNKKKAPKFKDSKSN